MARDRPRSLPFQLQLTTLFIFTGFVCAVCAWWGDHSSLVDRVRELELENRIHRDHGAKMRAQILDPTFRWNLNHTWSTTDKFIQMVREDPPHDEFAKKSTAGNDLYRKGVRSIAIAKDPFFRDSVKQLRELLNHPNERIRLRALIALRYIQELSPDRIIDVASEIVSRVAALLDDPSGLVVGEAIIVLRLFGPLARDAVPALRDKLQDDWLASGAASAIARINGDAPPALNR